MVSNTGTKVGTYATYHRDTLADLESNDSYQTVAFTILIIDSKLCE